MRRTLLLVVLAVIGGFFNTGCSTAQRKMIYEEVKTYTLEQLAALRPGVEALIDAKMAEKEKAQLAELDKKLAEVAATDPASGAKIVLTWQNFDTDKNGHLDLMELGKASMYMTARAADKVSSGEWTKDDAKKYGTGAAGVVALLAAVALYNRWKGNGAAPTPPAVAAAPPAPGK
jgi:hypothetical protein